MSVLEKDKELKFRRTSLRKESVEAYTPTSPHKKVKAHPTAWFASAFFIMALSFFVGGLTFVQNQLHQSWTTQFDRFRWLVFVQGDQLQVDEVGRYLKQLDTVQNVKFISSEMAFQSIRKNALFVEEMKEADPNLLPPSWEIQWQRESWIELDGLRDNLRELQAFPGVLDVAYDVDQWKVVQEARKSWAQVKTFSSFTALLAVIGVFAFITWAFFFSTLRKLAPKSIATLFVFDGLLGALGIFLVSKTLGTIHPAFYAIGLAVFPFHFLWVAREKK